MPEGAGALFYERLFADHPDLRPLFKHDMRVQGVKLMTMLAMVVYHLHEPGQVLPAIRDLGFRHVGYGVKPAGYEALKAALLWTLDEALGQEFTPAARDAWALCYDELAEAMKNGRKRRATLETRLAAKSRLRPDVKGLYLSSSVALVARNETSADAERDDSSGPSILNAPPSDRSAWGARDTQEECRLIGLAVAAALAAATPAFAVLNHNALVSNTPIQNALVAIGSAVADLNRAATDPVALPDGVGGVLVVDFLGSANAIRRLVQLPAWIEFGLPARTSQFCEVFQAPFDPPSAASRYAAKSALGWNRRVQSQA
jgi:nitric oxide dioxygenase